MALAARLGFALVLASCAAPPADEAATAPAAPPKPVWSLRYEYHPGPIPKTSWAINWSATIDSTGRCLLTERRWGETGPLTQREVEIDRVGLDRLHAELDASLFDALEIAFPPTGVRDYSTMALEHVEAGVSHRVIVGAPESYAWGEDRDDKPRELHPGKRFLAVVVQVLRLVRSPIEEQTPELYERYLAKP